MKVLATYILPRHMHWDIKQKVISFEVCISDIYDYKYGEEVGDSMRVECFTQGAIDDVEKFL